MTEEDDREWAEEFAREPLTNAAIAGFRDQRSPLSLEEARQLAEEAAFMRHAFTLLLGLTEDQLEAQGAGQLGMLRLWAEGRRIADP